MVHVCLETIVLNYNSAVSVKRARRLRNQLSDIVSVIVIWVGILAIPHARRTARMWQSTLFLQYELTSLNIKRSICLLSSSPKGYIFLLTASEHFMKHMSNLSGLSPRKWSVWQGSFSGKQTDVFSQQRVTKPCHLSEEIFACL